MLKKVELTKINNIYKHIFELNGYLNAVSHFNDQIGYRHGFFVDLIESNNTISESIENHLNVSDIELKEINLRDETKIIKSQAFNNFLFKNAQIQKETLSFVQEQICWHIQEYLSLIETEFPNTGKWLCIEAKENAKNTYIINKHGDYLIIIGFQTRKEDIEA